MTRAQLVRLRTCVFAAVFCAVLFVNPSFATIINVPTDFPTIQAAVNAAAPGDTINVAGGTYIESVTVTASLTIKGAGVGLTIVQGAAPASATASNLGAFTVNSIGATVTIQNLTIQNSKAQGGAGQDGNGNTSGAGGGGGFGAAIFIGASSTVNLDTVAIQNNSTKGGAGGSANGACTTCLGNSSLGSGAAFDNTSTLTLGGGGGRSTGSAGGAGGFAGGGGGAGSILNSTGGAGGFPAGAGGGPNATGAVSSASGGGGGAGLGGAIFIAQQGFLTVTGTLTINGNTVAGGAGGAAGGGVAGNAGAGYGGGIFMQGNSAFEGGSGVLTFNPGPGVTQTVSDAIGDQSGNGGTAGNAGMWIVTKNGIGTLVLGGANSVGGFVDVMNGTLQLDGSVGTVKLQSTRLTGNGTLATIDPASASFELSPGDPITKGTLTITSPLTLDAYSTVSVRLDHTSGGAPVAGVDYDSLVSGGVFDLASATLRIKSVGAGVQTGDTFTIVQGASVVGQFGTGTSPIFVNGQKFTVAYLPTSVVLTAALTGTSTSVGFSQATPTYGTAVNYTATVAAEAGGTTLTTGSVTITDLTTSTTLANNVAVNTSGQVIVTGVVPSAVTHTIQAVYTPGAGYVTTMGSSMLTVSKAVLLVTADAKSITYPAANPTFTATISQFVNSENSSVVSGSASYSTNATLTNGKSNAGSWTITPAIGTLTAGNYTFTFATGAFSVAQATASVTASTPSKNYGTVYSSTSDFTTSGFVNGDSVTGVTLTSTGSPMTATVAGSPYTLAPSAAVGTGLANYMISYNNGTLTVNPATLTITGGNPSKVYGTVYSSTSAFTPSTLYNSDSVTSVTLTSTGSPATAAVAGSPYALVPSAAVGSGLSNYNIGYANGTLTVARAVLTVTANSATRIFGAANPTFTATITNFVNGENASVVSGSAALNTAAIPTSTVGPYTITAAAGTLAAANYSFTFVNGTLTVSPSTLTVNPGGATRTYGAANSLGYYLTGFANSDTSAVVSGAPQLFSPASTISSPGTYPVTATVGSLSATNYTFTFLQGTLIVTKAPAALGINGLTPGISANPGQTFTVNYIVVGVPGAALPTGTVSYTVDNGALQNAAISNGAATTSFAGLAVGAHTVSNFYAGDTNYLATTATPITLTITVTKSLTQFGVVTSATTLPQGQPFTLTFSISGSSTTLATGTVSCSVDGGPALPASVNAGSATLTLSSLSIGTHSVVCSYGGDANFAAASGSAFTLVVTQATPAINAGGIVSAASGAGISPGGLLSIYGSALANGSANATTLPLPITLNSVLVLVNGAPCPLLYVGPAQINCIAPYATPVGFSVQVVVVVNGVSGLPVTATFSAYAPAVFTYARTATSNDPVITHANNTLVTPTSPAQGGEVLVIYATGAGKIFIAPADGAAAPATPPATTVDTPAVTVGTANATVQFSGLAPGFVGLLQLNVQLPAVLPVSTGTPASLPLVITFAKNPPSPAVNLWVK